MLGVSLRVTEAADVGAALQRYITSNYTAEETKTAARGIADVQALRSQLVSSLTRNAAEADHAATLHVFQRYYATLTCLVSRFPFQSSTRPVADAAASGGFLSKMMGAKKVSQVTLQTTWFDAFRHSNRVQAVDIEFERLSVMFNLAALYSRQATQLKTSPAVTSSGPDGSSALQNASLKEACRLFQLSSGVFGHLSTLPEVTSGAVGAGMSIDLQADSLAMLASLMLAQAQACFFEAATHTASPKLVAKLAMGCSALFHASHVRCEKNLRLKAVQGKPGVYPWSTHAQYQSLCYQAAAHYWQAKGSLAEDDYGPEIAHLERARVILAQARTREVGLLRNLADNRSRLDSALATRLAAAHKDNETIYYASVPKPETVRDPEQVTAVKQLPLDTPGGIVVDPQTADPFLFLVSPFLRAQHDSLRAKIDGVQKELAARVTQSEATSKAELEKLGLPASLDALSADGSVGVPDAVWSSIQDVQYKGGVTQLDQLNSQIVSAVADCEAAFQESVALLGREADTDARMRTQFQHRWNRRPSEQLTVALQRDADSIRRFLRDAEASNTKIRNELQTSAPRFELLTLSQADLNAKLPRATAEQSQGSQEAVRTLRQLLAQLQDNSSKLQQLVPAFESRLQSTDLMAVLTASNAQHAGSGSAGGTPTNMAAPDAAREESLLATALQPFQTFHTTFDEAVAVQSQLLQQIGAANEQFLSRRSSDDSTARRQSFLQELNVSVSSYNRLLANLNEGLKFYSDLQAQKIAPFGQKVADFSMARGMEAQLILGQLTKAIGGAKDEDKQQSVFPQASAAGGPAAGQAPGGNPFMDADVYAGDQPVGAGQGVAAAASNPNLAYEPKHLYSLHSPPPAHGQAPQGPPQGPPGAGGAGQAHPAHARPAGYGNPFQQQQQSQPQQHQQYQQQAHPPQQPHQAHAPVPQQYQAPYHAHAHAQPPPVAHPPASFMSHFQSAQQQQQQQRPPVPMPVAQQPQWPCPSCTYLNPLAAATCEMCGGRRP